MSISEEQSFPIAHDSRLQTIYRAHLTHEWGEEMHIKCLSHGLYVDTKKSSLPPDQDTTEVFALLSSYMLLVLKQNLPMEYLALKPCRTTESSVLNLARRTFAVESTLPGR